MSLTIHLTSRTEVGMMQKCVPILLLCYKEVDLFLIFDKIIIDLLDLVQESILHGVCNSMIPLCKEF